MYSFASLLKNTAINKSYPFLHQSFLPHSVGKSSFNDLCLVYREEKTFIL
jgi:hypothetical protein